MRTLIGLVVAAAIIFTGGHHIKKALGDYLVDTDKTIPSLDWGRFVYDMSDKYIEYVYETNERLYETAPKPEASTEKPTTAHTPEPTAEEPEE